MPETLNIVVTDAGAAGAGGVPGGAGASAAAKAPSATQQRGPAAPAGAAAANVPKRDPSAKSDDEQRRLERERQEREQRVRTGIGRAEAVVGAAAAGRVGAAAAQGGAAISAVAGPVGIAALALTAAVGVAVKAVQTFTSALQAQAESLARFSPEAAQAQAETEIRRIRAQIRRAETIGPQIAGVERLRARFEENLTDLGTRILAVLLRILEDIRPGLEAIVSGIEKAIPLTEGILAGIGEATLVFPTIRAIKTVLDKILGNVEPDEEEDAAAPFLDEFINMLPRPALFWPGDQDIPARVELEPGL